ncbi:variant leucine-rich repeat-containing protein [Cryobacterium zhongshanensis]|uniref:Leucine rich repeat variant domain-containing protein n=1 Tax=Cryobacterium zhongshanensis TaxID=2928153 RepID=A0AA41QX29_9MICO|nr:hypothetical protein [Cryobacterium zhongshanensis]MCI4658183.1 hypothetical protein [Cryobacterium zhongshanensis]
MSDSRTLLFVEAANPATSPARLAELAAKHFDLHRAIAANPACYPGLLEWMRGCGTLEPLTPAAAQAPLVAQAPTVVDAQAPSAAQAQAPRAAQAQAQSPAVTDAEAPTRRAAHAAPSVPAYAVSRSDSLPVSGPVSGPLSGSAGAGSGAPGGWQQPIVRASAAASAGRRRRRPCLLWGSIGVVVLVLAGGGVWAYASVFSKSGGSSTPQAAVEKLLTGAVSLDVLNVYGSLSPAEISSLRAPVETLGRIKLDSATSPTDYTAVFEKLRPNLNVTLTGLEFSVTDIGDGIAAVAVNGGQLHVDGDPTALASLWMDAVKSQLTAQLKATGSTDEQVAASLEKTRAAAVAGIDAALPYDRSASDLKQDLGRDVTAVAVHEGGSWYVSPLLTGFEQVFQDRLRADPTLTRGPLVAPAIFATPEDAVRGLADGVSDYLTRGDSGALAAALPLAERRVVSLYGAHAASVDGRSLNVTNVGVSSTVSGDTARITLDDLSFAGESDSVPYAFSISGVCATVGSASGARVCLCGSLPCTTAMAGSSARWAPWPTPARS